MEAIINLLPKQTQAFEYFENPSITELGYGGGAGGGKSRLGCYIAITVAEMYPNSRGAIGRKELKTLRLTTLATLFEILKELNYQPDKDYVYHAQDGVIKFSNGSQIYILDTAYSPQDPEYTRFGSLELTWAWIDESNETPLKAKQILKTRVGRKNNLDGKEIKPFWFETFNPDKGHVYTDYFKPYKEGKLPPYRAFVQALPTDNPYLPEAYIEQLRRSDKVTRERLLYGNFDYDSDPSALISFDAISDLFTNPVPEAKDKYITADIARHGSDKTVFFLWQGLRVKKIFEYSKQGIDETAQKLKDLIINEQVPYSQVIADEDGVGGGVVDILRGIKGFIANSTPVEIIKDRPENFQNLKAQCGYKLAEYVNLHKIAIECSPEHRELISQELQYIKSYQIDKDTKLKLLPKDMVKEAIGRSPDFSDNLIMRMWFEFNKPNNLLIAMMRQRQLAKRNNLINDAR